MSTLENLKQQFQKFSMKQKGEGRDRSGIVSWLFLIGSLIFMLDSLLELTEGLSIHVVFHLSAGLLFTIGSLLFIPSNPD